MPSWPSDWRTLGKAVISSTDVVCSPAQDTCVGLRLTAQSSAVWPTANLARFCPIIIDRPVVVTKMGWINGTVVAGNVDIGIYDYESKAKLVGAGSTAQATVSALQIVDITDTTLLPGVYYFAMVMSSTTATVVRVTPHQTILTAAGCGQMATTIPLPTTLTYTAVSSSLMPVMYALANGTIL